MLLNVGFGITIVAALLLLLVAVAVGYYNDHLSEAGSVNGQSISKDAYRKQLAINTFRTDYQNRQIRTLLTAGHLRTADAEARQSLLSQRSQQAAAISLEQLVDGIVMAQLAPEENVTVTRRGDRRAPHRRRDHARAAPWLDDRRRARARRGGDGGHRRGEGRRQGQGRPGARGPQGGPGLGDRRQGHLDGRDQGTGR